MYAMVFAWMQKSGQFLEIYRSDALCRKMIYMILAANLGFVLLHVNLKLVSHFEIFRDTLFHPDGLLTTEGGYSEVFNYIQLAALSLVMFHIFARTRQPIYASIGLVFLLALGEDALQLHERVGLYAESIGLATPSFLRIYQFGEILHWLVIGALCFAALFCGLLSSSAEDMKIGTVFVSLIFMLGFCSAFLDAVNSLHGKFFGAAFILGIAEDGGEMLVVALALSTALLLFRHLDELRGPAR